MYIVLSPARLLLEFQRLIKFNEIHSPNSYLIGLNYRSMSFLLKFCTWCSACSQDWRHKIEGVFQSWPELCSARKGQQLLFQSHSSHLWLCCPSEETRFPLWISPEKNSRGLNLGQLFFLLKKKTSRICHHLAKPWEQFLR